MAWQRIYVAATLLDGSITVITHIVIFTLWEKVVTRLVILRVHRAKQISRAVMSGHRDGFPICYSECKRLMCRKRLVKDCESPSPKVGTLGLM